MSQDDNPTDLVDIGVNLTSHRFDRDRSDVLTRAREAGIGQCVIIGTTLDDSREAASMCREYAGEFPGMLSATAGIHPHHASTYNPGIGTELRALIAETKAVAVGETGLDFNRDFSPRDAQQRAFEAQLALAAELEMPLLLHERDAHQRQIEILREYRDQLPGAVIHCFTGDRRSLYNYLDLDLYVGVTGWLCDERRGGELREAVADIPPDRLLVETDAPYLLPRTLTPRPADRRNEPAFLGEVLNALVRYTGRSRDAIARATAENARRLFKIGA